MRWLVIPFATLTLCAAGCGGGDLPTTTDPEAIRKEQERLRNEIPGIKGKFDPVKAEQDRLKGKMPGSR